MIVYIGIDPGKSGGICYQIGTELVTKKCPDTVAGMLDILLKAKADAGNEVKCVMEAVHSMPRDGVKQCFSFGKNVGQWQGILAALHIPYIEVSPQKWQKLGGTLPKDKTLRKKKIQDAIEKKIGVSVPLYIADAIAIHLLAPKLWGDK